MSIDDAIAEIEADTRRRLNWREEAADYAASSAASLVWVEHALNEAADGVDNAAAAHLPRVRAIASDLRRLADDLSRECERGST